MKFSTFSALVGVWFSSIVTAQLSGTVGPTTSTAAKAAKKICNILSYGGVASTSTDNGPAILAAWTACKSGGEGSSSILFESENDFTDKGQKSIFLPETMASQLGLR